VVAVLTRGMGVPIKTWMIRLAPEGETFGAILRQERLRRGLQQEEVARMFGMVQTNYGRYERDAYHRVPAEFYSAVADEFGIPLDRIVAGVRATEARHTELPGASVAIPAHEPLTRAIDNLLFGLEDDELERLAALDQEDWRELVRLDGERLRLFVRRAGQAARGRDAGAEDDAGVRRAG
jgi:transcriptional regulator with XRE-family HTH domain